MSAVLAILVALLKAIPAFDNLVRQALAERDLARETTAGSRKTAKDATVDAAIDGLRPNGE